MTVAATLRAMRAEIFRRGADSHGCIRIHRSDALDLLDTIEGLHQALDQCEARLAEPRAQRPRFSERLRAGPAAGRPARAGA